VWRPDAGARFVTFAAAVSALAIIGLHFASSLPGWITGLSVALLVFGAALLVLHGIATTAMREKRGVITHVHRVVVQQADGGYRGPAREPTLSAAGRSWQLAELRGLEIGKDGEHYALYLVLPDEVLEFLHREKNREAIVRVAERLGELVDKSPRETADRSFEGESPAAALLVFPPLLLIVAGAYAAYVNATSPLSALVGLVAVLLPAGWTHAISWRTRRMLLPHAVKYARERFGIEPHLGSAESENDPKQIP
jgi:hypothetical protein